MVEPTYFVTVMLRPTFSTAYV